MRRAVGFVIPSSNRNVERTVNAILRHIPEVDACFARITYYGEGIGQPHDGYDLQGFRAAAWHLSHAEADVLCWNGSRGAGLGLAKDEALCAAMAEVSGRPATTAALAAARLLARFAARRLGFVVPGGTDYAADAARGFGLEMAAARGFGLTDNLAAARLDPEEIAGMAREVARAAPDAILIWGTNMPGLAVMAPLEAELGVPVIDSASAGLWGCLTLLGVSPRPARALGRIFGLTDP